MHSILVQLNLNDGFIFIYSIPLSLSIANKVKQTLSKILYQRVFENVVALVNADSNSSMPHPRPHLTCLMLDIAGFGKSVEN